MLLEVENIHTAYGLIRVLFGISLNIEQGQVVTLLGRNVVGKTTLQMWTKSTFTDAGWDFDFAGGEADWFMQTNNYP